MDEHIRILAVDDEPDLRSLLRILLTGKGFQVSEAASGQAAVELIRQEPAGQWFWAAAPEIR